MAAFLQRSSYAPTHVNVYAPPQKPPKKHRFCIKRRPVQEPSATLHGEVVEEVFSHTSRVENLHLEGDTKEVVRILASLEESTPLVSLRLATWDSYISLSFELGGEEDHVNTSFILPENFLGGRAPQLRRLHCREILHVTFPSWVLGTISELSVSCFYCPIRLFAIIRQMPQLEILRISSRTGYEYVPDPDVIMPVHLNNLSLLVFDGDTLGLLVALLGSLSTTSSVRKHISLDLKESNFTDPIWEKFTSLICSKTALPLVPLHGMHFRVESFQTSIRVWTSPESRLPRSPWPPQDEPFSLEIHGTNGTSQYRLHTSSSNSVFHRLQEFCVSLGRETIQELFVENRIEQDSYRHLLSSCSRWLTLFSGLSSIKTLHFGDGAAELLIGARPGPHIIRPSTTDCAAICRIGFSDLKQVIISSGAFNTQVLWTWIHYASTRPTGAEIPGIRMDALARLAQTRPKPVYTDFEEGLTRGLIEFLLNCRSTGVHISEVWLVNPTWDELGGFEMLRRLLHVFDPDLNVILKPICSD
jgi:hypothetical protein